MGKQGDVVKQLGTMIAVRMHKGAGGRNCMSDLRLARFPAFRLTALRWTLLFSFLWCYPGVPSTLFAMGLPDQALNALTSEPGNLDRGRDVVLKPEKGNCILCHAVPEPSVRFSGDLGPPLHGVGARLSAAQLRFRVIDASRLNSDTVMPAYHRSENLKRVAPQFQGLPILSAQEVEDLVAYLSSLK